MSGLDMTLVLLAVLAQPMIFVAMAAGLVRLGLLTAHLHKPSNAPADEK